MINILHPFVKDKNTGFYDTLSMLENIFKESYNSKHYVTMC